MKKRSRGSVDPLPDSLLPQYFFQAPYPFCQHLYRWRSRHRNADCFFGRFIPHGKPLRPADLYSCLSGTDFKAFSCKILRQLYVSERRSKSAWHHISVQYFIDDQISLRNPSFTFLHNFIGGSVLNQCGGNGCQQRGNSNIHGVQSLHQFFV